MVFLTFKKQVVRELNTCVCIELKWLSTQLTGVITTSTILKEF